MAGIYIHIPFCKKACHYCDFHFSTSLKKKEDMIHALGKELQLRSNELKGQVVETIYFGGGTPSLLTIEELRFLINEVHKSFHVSKNPEITLEANPDDLKPKLLKNLLATQINRLSIGIQSFFEDDLANMNRAHNANEAKECLREATKYFNNISIDLIYGIPNMTLDKWNENLDIAFSFSVNHISAYALTVEPKTALADFIKKGFYPPVDEDLALQHFNHLVKKAKERGFVHYEISNFGKSNFYSQHNTSYWQGKPYLGIGPSAHSFDGLNRSWNVSNNIRYIQALKNESLPNTIEELSKTDCFNEKVMIGLRTIWGVSLSEIENRFGEFYKQHLIFEATKFVNQELLEITIDNNGKHLKATESGKFLIDGIASDLFIIN